MPLAYGALIEDGRYTKSFTVTGLDNDVAADLVVALNGAGGRPTAFNVADLRPSGAPLEATVVRTDNGAGAASEFGYHTLTATSITIRKYTASGAGAAVSVRVVIRAVSPVDR